MLATPAAARTTTHWFRFLLLCLVLDALVLAVLAKLTSDERIYLRNITFSRIIADRRIGSEAALNGVLAQGFLDERDTSRYREFLNPAKADALSALQRQSSTTDEQLAIAITQQLGDFANGRVCGIESMGRIVFDTERGLGCCSDFSKSWIFYARFLGMQVREVNTLNHTTVEFYDHQVGRWVWLDPLNRLQITNAANQPLSQYQIRDNSLFTALRVMPLMGERPGFDAEDYEGYDTAQAAVLMWRMGTNFLEIERHDRRLREWGLPKAARQVILLTVGVQPRWVILTTLSLAAYLRALQAFIIGSFGMLLLVHAGLVVYGAQAWRQRRAAKAPP